MAELQGFIDELLRALVRVGSVRRRRGSCFFQDTRDNLHVMLAKTVEPQRFAGGIDFAIGADFRVAVLGRPFGDVGVKAFAILHDRREQQQVAALLSTRLADVAAEFVARLGFDRQLAIGAILRARAARRAGG